LLPGEPLSSPGKGETEPKIINYQLLIAPCLFTDIVLIAMWMALRAHRIAKENVALREMIFALKMQRQDTGSNEPTSS